MSEFTFDEENNGSNEGGEEEEIDNSDSDWEKDDSEQIKIHVSDLMGCHEFHERAPELPKREICPECGAFFGLGKNHTCEYKIKPVSCIFCGKRCMDKIALKAHSKIHKESYEHPSKRVSVRVHTLKAKPYQCPDVYM